MLSDMSRLSVSSSNSLRKSSPSARKRAQSLGRLGEERECEPYQYEDLLVPDHGGGGEHDGQGHWRRSTDRDRARNIHSESGTPHLGFRKGAVLQPNGMLMMPRAKSTHEVSITSLEAIGPPPFPPPLPPPHIPVPYPPPAMCMPSGCGSEMGSPVDRMVARRDMGPPPMGPPPMGPPPRGPPLPPMTQKPITCFYNPTGPMQPHPPPPPPPMGNLGGHTPEMRPSERFLIHPQNSPGRPYSSYDLKVTN